MGRKISWKRTQVKAMRKIDLTGRRFGRLLVLMDTGKRSGSSVIWRCRCDCGTVKDIPARNLLHRGTVSCGCHRRAQSAINLSGDTAEKFGQIDGTNVSRLRSEKPQANNRTGYKGVSWVNYPHGGGAYLAVIYFRGKRYRLGFYKTAEDASKAYLSAKSNLHGDFITWYDQHKEALL